MHSASYDFIIGVISSTTLLHMKLRKALLLVQARWHVSGYRLSQVSNVDKSLLGKLLRGETQTTSWDKVEQLANGFEQIDPIAKDAFIGALQRPDRTYPHFSDNTIDLFWQRERSENIAAVMVALDQLGLLNREAIQELEARLREKREITISNTPVEDCIGSTMMAIRRKQEGSSQNA